MSKRILSVLALLATPVFAEPSEVYLVASVQLGGSNLAQSIFLHEPQIATLEECQEAMRVGQRDRDWQRYHHIFMRDRFQGFTGHLDYRCVFTTQRFSAWNDRALARRLDRVLELSGLTPTVEKVFRLTRMDTIFTIHRSVPGDLRDAV